MDKFTQDLINGACGPVDPSKKKLLNESTVDQTNQIMTKIIDNIENSVAYMKQWIGNYKTLPDGLRDEARSGKSVLYDAIDSLNKTFKELDNV